VAKPRQRLSLRLPDPDPSPPPRAIIRDRAGDGPTAVMRGTWRDPDDLNPQGRTPREVKGHRTFDPLRMMLRRHGLHSSVNVRHIWSADRLREAVDLATYGATGGSAWEAVGAGFGPSMGPGAVALARLRAQGIVERVRCLYSPSESLLLDFVVLDNRSITSWCLRQHYTDAAKIRLQETALLVTLLDRLEAHFAAEIDADLRAGRLLDPV
jgi:hypothetical protein